jgi:NAD(P)-dependent dehydrogenase (short-subunit alcohol dehydrogenase family)
MIDTDEFPARIGEAIVQAFLDRGYNVVARMGRKRHSECLPLSVWCFWLWCNASQLPISRQSFFCGVTSRLPVIQEFLESIHTSWLQN